MDARIPILMKMDLANDTHKEMIAVFLKPIISYGGCNLTTDIGCGRFTTKINGTYPELRVAVPKAKSL